jgi:putative peptidoglycan lipid II flippase
LVTAILPAISRAASQLDYASIRSQLGRIMRLVAVFMTPIAALLFVEGPRITQLLFARGSASVDESLQTGLVLSAFVVGLVPFALYYVLLRGYYSLENTKTPFMLAVGLNIVNLAIAIPLYYWVNPQYRVASLALAFSLAYFVFLVVSWRNLSKRLGGLETYATVRTIVRTTIAAIPCGIAGWAALHGLMSIRSVGFVWLLLSLAVATLAGGSVFLVLAWFMRISEVRSLPALVRRHSL